MSLMNTAIVALKALRRNPSRALLTTLGIVIGIAAVITMTEITGGSSTSIRQSIEKMGASSAIVLPGGRRIGGVSLGSGSTMSLTPDDAEFDSVYQIAKDMYAAATGGASGTIGEWVKANHPDTAYDPQFESTPMSSVNSIAYGMKVLYLTGFTYSDRDLSLRMQFGLNFVRDSAMYTYNDDWITELDPRGDIAVMAYRQQVPLKTMSDVIDAMITSDRVQDSLNGVDGAIPKDGECYGTPAWWCLFKTKDCQDLLDKAIQEEQDLLGN